MVNNFELFSDAKATARLGDRNKEERLKAAAEAYQSEPDSVESALSYADALFDAHRLDEAMEVLVHAEKLTADSPDVLYNLAFLFNLQGEDEKARECFRRVVQLADSRPLAKSAEYELWRMGEEMDAKWMKH